MGKFLIGILFQFFLWSVEVVHVKKLFWIVTSFAAVSSIGASMILPYIPVYGREVGMSVGLVGYLVFIYYGVEALTRVPVGSLSDVIGHSKVILVGGFSLLLAGVSYLLSSEVSQLLFVAQLFFGVGISITWVTIPSFVTKMEHSVSKYTFSVGLGWLIGPPIGGFIKDSWGMFVLFWIFFFINVVIVVISILFYIFNDEESEVEIVEVRDGLNVSKILFYIITPFKRAYPLLKKKKIFLASMVSFIMFMIFAMGASLIPLYLDEIGLIGLQIGILQSVRTSSSTGIRLGTNKILRYADDMTILGIGMGLTGISIVLIPLTEIRIILGILSVTWGLGGGLYLPIVFDLIGKCTEPEERGLAMGLRGTMGTLGSAIGVLVFSNIADKFGVRISLEALGVLVLVSSGILLLTWKVSNSDE